MPLEGGEPIGDQQLGSPGQRLGESGLRVRNAFVRLNQRKRLPHFSALLARAVILILALNVLPHFSLIATSSEFRTA